MKRQEGSKSFTSVAPGAKGEDANSNETTNKHNGTKENQHPQGDKSMKRCKLVIVGDGCCGKTSLLTVFKRYKLDCTRIK